MTHTHRQYPSGTAYADQRFDRRVSFLAEAFTGMAWDGPSLSHAETARYVKQGHTLRSAAFHAALSAAAGRIGDLIRWLRKSGRTVADAIARERERRATIRTLRALNDHILHDIGLHRSEIPTVVEQLFDKASATRATHPTETVVTTRNAAGAAANDDAFQSAA
ncbi:MAG: DUF1127 domain-containing protein [Acidiferrobacterales bacterium]